MNAPSNILSIIHSNKTSLGDNPALPPEMEDKFLALLVNDYYDYLSSHFDEINIDEISKDLNETLSECKKIESQSESALMELCSEELNYLFRIPNDTVICDVRLVSKVDVKQERLVPETSSEFSFENIDDINDITDEIYKRRMLNALVIGAAMYYSEKIIEESDGLCNVNEYLKKIYKKIMCINNLLMFHTSPSISKKHTDGGVVDVYITDPLTPPKIEAQGVIFPILLEESIRGFLELSISHGLPKDRARAEYITSKTDFKLAEIWDQRLGLPLWKRIEDLMGKIGKSTEEIGLNFIFMELSQLKPKHFNSVMQEIFAHTRIGKKLLNEITNKIQYQKDQDEFNDYMTTKNDGKYQINDSDFTSDELINNDWCSTTILDETDL